MKLITICLLFYSLLMLSACSKWGGEKKDKMSIEGIVRDQYNSNPVAGVDISVTAVKSGSGGWGLNFDSKSEVIGNTKPMQVDIIN